MGHSGESPDCPENHVTRKGWAHELPEENMTLLRTGRHSCYPLAEKSFILDFKSNGLNCSVECP